MLCGLEMDDAVGDFTKLPICVHVNLLCYRDVKASSFIADLEKNREAAHFLLQRVPHVLPHREVTMLE